MAARASIRFSTRGAGQTVGKVRGIGAAFGGLGKSSKSASFGIGQVAYRLYNTLARISMVRRGVSGMSREVKGAENKWRGWGRAMSGGPFSSVLAGLSKKFAEVRRTIAFYILAVKDYVKWGKKMTGVGKAVSKVKAKVPVGAGAAIAKERAAARASAIADKAALKASTKAARAAMAARTAIRIGEAKKITAAEAKAARAAAALQEKARRAAIQNAWWARSRRRAGLPSVKTGGAPPVKPPPSGIVASFGKLGGAYRVAATAAKILTGAVIALTVALTALYTYIAYKTAKMVVGVVKGFMSIRETFRKYEISLGGIIRNTAATAKIMKFATKYAAEYPAMFEDVIDAFRGLASMPTLKPLFRKADYDDLKGIMDIVQGLATLKPQQGVQGAMMALREALSGQMRSLRMRFEVNVREMAEVAGFSFGEITHDANKALIAIRKFVELNVPAEAMASMAKTIEVQWGNVYDKYRTFVNEMMKSTGAYWAVVEVLEKLNEWFEKVFAAPAVVGFAQKIGNALREVVQLFESAMTGFDWKGYLEVGDVLGAVRDLCERIQTLFKVLWEEYGEEAKRALKKVVNLLKEVLKPAFKVIAASFWKMMEAGATDAGRIVAKLFGIAFKGTVKAIIGGAWKELTTLKSPLMDWGQKPKVEIPEIETRESKTEKPLGYIGQTLKTAADYWKQKLKVPAIEKPTVKVSTIEKTKVEALAIEKPKIVVPAVEKIKKKEPLDKLDKFAEQKLKTAADYWKQKLKTAADYWKQKLKTAADYWKPKVEIPKVEIPKVEIPKVEIPKVEIPKVEKIDPLKQAALLGDRLRRQAKAMRERILISEPEPVETGEDIPLKINERALKALKEQEKIKNAILKTEQKIYKLKKGGVKNAQQLIDIEVQLLNSVIERYKAEGRLAEIVKQRGENEKDIAELKEYGSQELNKIVTLENELLRLAKEKVRTEQQMAGADSNQKKLKEQMVTLETQISKKSAKIADLRDGNIRGINAIIKLEANSITLAKEKLDTEQRIAKAGRDQLRIKEKILDFESKIQMMEMVRGVPGKIGLSVIDRAKGIFATFRDWMEKEQKDVLKEGWPQMVTIDKKGEAVGFVQAGMRTGPTGQMWSAEAAAADRRVSEAKVPGMGMAWRESIEKSLEPATQGIPQFFLRLEEILREKLGRPDVSLPVQKSLLERLYNLNVEQFRVATGPAKGVQFLEANEFMEKLMGVENQLQGEQLQLVKGQARNVETIVGKLESVNTWLSEIYEKVGRSVSQQPVPGSVPSPANPSTQTE